MARDFISLLYSITWIHFSSWMERSEKWAFLVCVCCVWVSERVGTCLSGKIEWIGNWSRSFKTTWKNLKKKLWMWKKVGGVAVDTLFVFNLSAVFRKERRGLEWWSITEFSLIGIVAASTINFKVCRIKE